MFLGEHIVIVNIIVPIYNTNPDFIQEAIDSIELQTFKDWKLIIVDDASTNIETLKFLHNINHEKIKIEYLDINTGEMNTRFHAAKLLDTDCEYIAFMDADDVMLPARIATQLSYLQNNPSIDVVGAQMQMFYEPLNTPYALCPKFSFTSHPTNVNNYIFIKHWCINNPSSFMRRKCMDNFDINIVNNLQNLLSIHKNKFGDYIFYAHLAKNNYQIRNLEEILLMYRCTHGQLTQSEDVKTKDSNIKHKLVREIIFLGK